VKAAPTPPNTGLRWCSPSPPLSPSVDVSLEEALFDKENLPYSKISERGREKGRERGREREPCKLPSPRLSRIEVDTSRSIGGSKPTASVLRKVGQEKKNKRGLTVSFVQEGSGKGEVWYGVMLK
jgi:hypothetical protein